MSTPVPDPGLHLERDDDGQWHWTPPEAVAAAKDQSPAYLEAIPRYFGAFDRLFHRAANTCEFEFVMTLLRVRGMSDAGWDPFETTLRAIAKVRAVLETQDDYEVRRHLSLWLYGHIYEASESYELMANLIEIAGGGSFRTDHFPRSRGGTTPGPGRGSMPMDQLRASVACAAPATHSIGALHDRRGGPLFSRSEARLPAESRQLGSPESRRIS